MNKLLAGRAKSPPATAPKMTGNVAGALSRKTAANADRDAKDAALEARVGVLEKEVSDLKKVSHSHADSKPKVCCRAMSKACLACSQGITEAEFCRKNEGKYGCKSAGSSSGMGADSNGIPAGYLRYLKSIAPKGEEPVVDETDKDDEDEKNEPAEEPVDQKAEELYAKPQEERRSSSEPCMINGVKDVGAPFCHDQDRRWGKPTNWDPANPSLLEVGNKATATKDINWVIDLVKKAEKEYPKDDWKTMASRLRKVVYFGKLWDMLIPGSKDIAVIEPKGSFTQEDYNLLTKSNNNVVDLQGNDLDLNHIWVGIDVANNPNEKWYVSLFSGLQGPAVATWAGDVGSVLGEYYYKTEGDHDLDRYYQIFAGNDDMYSNADGYGIALQSVNKRWKLSQRMEHYYKKNVGKRVTYMCKAAKIKWKGKGKKLKLKYFTGIRRTARQIRLFAKLWRIHQCPHGWKKCMIPTSGDPMHAPPATRRKPNKGKTYLLSERNKVTEKFQAWLTTELRKENP